MGAGSRGSNPVWATLPGIRFRRTSRGRVPVEAILSGRPCLVSDSGELPYISPVPGTIFSAGSSSDLADKLQELTARDQTLQDVADQQYLGVQRFEAGVLAEQLNELWGRALKGG